MPGTHHIRSHASRPDHVRIECIARGYWIVSRGSRLVSIERRGKVYRVAITGGTLIALVRRKAEAIAAAEARLTPP